MTKDDIEHELHEIRQLCIVATRAVQTMSRVDTECELFCIREEDADLLNFSVFEILKRVSELKDAVGGGRGLVVPLRCA